MKPINRHATPTTDFFVALTTLMLAHEWYIDGKFWHALTAVVVALIWAAAGVVSFMANRWFAKNRTSP